MGEIGRELKIAHGVLVDVAPEVLLVRPEVAPEAMVEVQHARHAVEPETVEAELLLPVPHVGEQKPEGLELRVVPAERVPGRVLAARAGVEVLKIGSVEAPEALVPVLDGVRVDDVHHDGKPQLVCPAHQISKVVGRAEARGRRKERADVVAERPVVGMLLHRHELDGVVPEARDARQDVFRKLRPRPDPLVLRRHPRMRLVNPEPPPLSPEVRRLFRERGWG